MPHYYLHIEQHGEVVEDHDGAQFSDLEEARAEAIASAREIMSDRVAAGRPADGSVFNIVDDKGRTVLRVPFEAAIDHG